MKLSSGGGSAFLYAVELNYEEDAPPYVSRSYHFTNETIESTMSCITAIRKLWPSCQAYLGPMTFKTKTIFASFVCRIVRLTAV